MVDRRGDYQEGDDGGENSDGEENSGVNYIVFNVTDGSAEIVFSSSEEEASSPSLSPSTYLRMARLLRENDNSQEGGSGSGDVTDNETRRTAKTDISTATATATATDQVITSVD